MISIDELEKDINTRFGNENFAIYFGIGPVFYQSNPEKLIVTLGHYSSQDLEYKLTFSDVYSYRLIQESYFTYFEEDEYKGFSFFNYADNSRFKQDLVKNFSLGFSLGDNIEKINEIKNYRLLAQNNFIDILTTLEPMIEIIEKREEN